MARKEPHVTDTQWSEFLDKLDFVQLSGRWSMLPLHWLEEEPPEDLSEAETALFEALLELKDSEEDEREPELIKLAQEYRRKLASTPLTLDASLCPPGSRVNLRYMDPTDLGHGDCLVTVGNWDRVGHMISELAGGEEEVPEGQEAPVRREPGALSYRHLLIFPDKGTPSPRAFRSLCEKTLRQARGLGARRITVTHLHLPQPGLSDHFAAAELVSAVRQMLRDGSGMSVEIMTFNHRVYQDYKHWFLSLKQLTKSSDESPQDDPIPDDPTPGDAALVPDVAGAFKQFAQKTTSLAQEATSQVSGWLKNQTGPGHGEGEMPTRFRPSFEERQDLNAIYLGLWKEVEPDWSEETLSGLYLKALYAVVRSLDQPEEDADAKERELALLREEVLNRSAQLGYTHPLSRYFKLLAYRLDLQDVPNKAIALQAELSAEAEAWDDSPLAAFLQGQDPESEVENESAQLIPVYAVASRSVPDGGQEEEHNFE